MSRVAQMSASCFAFGKKPSAQKKEDAWKSVLQGLPHDLDFLPLDAEVVDHDLRCSVCLGWLKEPVVLPCPAQHMLCQACMEQLPERLCPIDRQPFTDVLQAPSAVRDQLASLKVCCPYAKDGCPWTGPCAEVLKHCAQNCSWALQECTMCGAHVQSQHCRAHVCATDSKPMTSAPRQNIEPVPTCDLSTIYAKAERLNVCFLVDCTAGVLPPMGEVKCRIVRIVREMSAHVPPKHLHLALVSYTDFHPGQKPVNVLQFTTTVEELHDFLAGIELVTTPPDSPGCVLHGLREVPKLDWGIGGATTRLLIHIGKSPCSPKSAEACQGDPDGALCNSVLKELQQNCIQCIFNCFNASSDEMLIVTAPEARQPPSADKAALPTSAASSGEERRLSDPVQSSAAASRVRAPVLLPIPGRGDVSNSVGSPKPCRHAKHQNATNEDDPFVGKWTTWASEATIYITRRESMYVVEHHGVNMTESVPVLAFPRFGPLTGQLVGDKIKWSNGSVWMQTEGHSAASMALARINESSTSDAQQHSNGKAAPKASAQNKRRFQIPIPSRMRRAAVSIAGAVATRVLHRTLCTCQSGAVQVPGRVVPDPEPLEDTPSGSAAAGQRAAPASVPSRTPSSKSSWSIRSRKSRTEEALKNTVVLDLESIIEGLLVPSTSVSSAKLPSEENVVSVLMEAQKLVMLQPMLLELETPLRVLGDIHGQFPDLLRMLEMGGLPPQANYLLLGDYVDRGQQSLETIVLLLAIKLKYPENFFLLRGNHECASINRTYGFYDECRRRYNVKLWKKFTDLFNCLPAAAVLNDKVFCCHGGLSPELDSLSDVNRLHRPTAVPNEGLLCDLLWADPSKHAAGWMDSERGVSYVFGPDVVASFTEQHGLDLIVRAHQVVEDGYEFFADRRVVTMFSAPNYLGEFDNDGAMLEIKEDLLCTFHLLRAERS